jgi:hypothetical protein
MAHLHNFSFEGLIFAANQAGLQLNSIQTMPNTKHLNAVFKKWAPQKVNLDPSVAPRVLMHLKNKKQGLDFLCSRPYLRLYANFKRPLKEYCGLLALGIPHDPKVLLDSLYSPVVLGKILHRSDEG